MPGMADIADALGVPRDRVLGKLTFEKFDVNKLYSCHTAGGARMSWHSRQRRYSSARQLRHAARVLRVRWSRFDRNPRTMQTIFGGRVEAGKDLPQDAIYSDMPERELVVTLAPVFGNYDPRYYSGLIQKAWPGWNVKLNFEGLSQHTKISRLDFDIPAHGLETMLQTLRQSACAPWTYDSAATVQPDFIERVPANSFHNHRVVLLSPNQTAPRASTNYRQLEVASD